MARTRKPSKPKPRPRLTDVESLHAAIDADPDDPANYQVLADHFLETGNSRGELMMLEGKRDRKTLELQAQLGPDINPGCVWKHGFVRHYTEYAGIESAATIRKHLGHPSLRHVTSIEIELAGSNLDKRQWLVDLIAETERPALRSLVIRGNTPELTDVSLAKLWTKKLPRLESVSVNARLVKLGKVQSATLAVLNVVSGIDDVDLKPLLTAKLPALRELRFEAELDGKQLAKLRASALGKRLGKGLIVHAMDKGRYDRWVE